MSKGSPLLSLLVGAPARPFPPPRTAEEYAMRIRLAQYDWIVINTSAGKDSQAMLDYVCKFAENLGVKDSVALRST